VQQQKEENGGIDNLSPLPTALTCGLPPLPDVLIDELNKE
jgi:hypothetical protein